MMMLNLSKKKPRFRAGALISSDLSQHFIVAQQFVW